MISNTGKALGLILIVEGGKEGEMVGAKEK